MKRVYIYIIGMILAVLSGCDVHEFPDSHYFPGSSDTPGNSGRPDDSGNKDDSGDQNNQNGEQNPLLSKILVQLNYDVRMTMWEHSYDGNLVIERGLGESYDSYNDSGMMRYIIRACPVSKDRAVSARAAHEYQFIKDVKAGYDAEFSIDVAPGQYNIMVWSDFLRESDIIYETGDFTGIMLDENSDMGDESNDAFRGTNDQSFSVNVQEDDIDTVKVVMQRPLAKFEFVANDLDEFVVKADTKQNSTKSSSDININDYIVRFFYVGFRPDVYSMYTDKPVDSSSGVTFESTMSQLDSSEVKIGFDYVFVGDQSSDVTLQIGVFDRNEKQISMTKPIKVPLMRGRHTVMTGAFLTPDASGGVVLDPDYNGDHNVVMP